MKFVIKFEKVAKKYIEAREEFYALKSTDFEARPGELIAVIGPSGSGKSTFLTIAGGLRTPSSGTVTINGSKTNDLNQRELTKIRRESVGFILQSSNLVPFLTVYKQMKFIDIMLKRKTDRSKIDQIFEDLGIEKLADKYPSELSGGERQRVAIAKTIYSDVPIILADEPTASLDSQKAYDVVKILAKETHSLNKTTIMVTHDQRLLEFCDSVYEIKDGQLEKVK